MLVNTFHFDDRGLRSNMKLFLDLKEEGHDILAFLSRIEGQAQQANSPQAYVIKSLQNLLNGSKPIGKKTVVDIMPPMPKKPSKPSDGKKPSAGGADSSVKKDRRSVKDASAFGDSGLEEL